MTREIQFGKKMVGDGHPAYIIAEIGINHNGNLETAKKMIDAAVHAGADAVKFQKRTPEVCTPPEQQKQMRETPWGYITSSKITILAMSVPFGTRPITRWKAWSRNRRLRSSNHTCVSSI